MKGSFQSKRERKGFTFAFARSLRECCVFGRRSGKAAAAKAKA